MSFLNGVSNLTEKILGEAREYEAEQLALAKSEAESIAAEYETQEKASFEAAVKEAESKASAVAERAKSQAEMDRRKMLLATKQDAINGAFALALEKLCSLSAEDKVLLMVRLAVKYQTQDAEFIFNKADREQIGQTVVDTVNAVYARRQLKDTFSGGFLEAVKKLVIGEDTKRRATLSDAAGSFAGGFILKQGDIENNCTFETLIGGMRDELEGEVSSLLFS